eukprot:UN31375
MSDYFLLLTIVDNLLELPTGGKKLTINTNKGNMKISAEEYMKLVKECEPSSYTLLSEPVFSTAYR